MLLVGPHVSIAKDISLSVERAHELGATGFAIFTKNQKVWQAKALEENSAEAFKANLERFAMSPSCVLPHAGYLINPATPDEELRSKSLSLLLDESLRVEKLGIGVLNLHPGAYIEGDREDGMKRVASFLDEALSRLPSDIRFSLENTAGSGTVLGSRLEELEQIISYSSHSDRLGVTIDTMHLFGAGYDVKSDIDGIMDEVMERFGREKLFGMHLNDSKVPLGSRKDRHESLGKGFIGMEPFLALAGRSDIEDRPLILETPDETLWKDEIAALLRSR